MHLHKVFERFEVGVKAKVKKYGPGKFAKSLKLKEKVKKEEKKLEEVEEVKKISSEFVGVPSRVVNEEHVQIFGEKGEVTKD